MIEPLFRTFLTLGTLLSFQELTAQSPLSADTSREQQSPSLNVLRLDFHIERAELAKPLKELNKLYQAQLEKLRLQSQERGALEQLIAVRAEQARVEGGTPTEEGTDFADLVKIRGIYERSRTERLALMHQQLLPLVARYRTLLEGLRSEQTIRRLLDEAARTQGEITEITSLETEIRRFTENPEETASSPALPNWGTRNLSLRMQVDGISHLYLMSGKIWFDHSRGRDKAPGRHLGEFPTYLNNKTEWLPVWNGDQTLPRATRILIPEDEPVNVHLRQIDGRGNAQVIQQPTSENDHTVIVELRDEGEGGRSFASSDWLEFRLSW